MESVTLFFFFILVYIQKDKKKKRDRQQYQFLGHLHFGQRTNKVVHFQKLEDEKNNKNKKKKLDATAGAQKQPHRKLGVSGDV